MSVILRRRRRSKWVVAMAGSSGAWLAGGAEVKRRDELHVDEEGSPYGAAMSAVTGWSAESSWRGAMEGSAEG